MTIAPQRAGKENFMVKSDYFDVDMNPAKQLNGGMQLKKYLLNFLAFLFFRVKLC